MRRLVVGSLAISMLGLLLIPVARADRAPRENAKPRHCGDKFVDRDDCAFRYQGGELSVFGSIRGRPDSPSGGTVRLETRNRETGARYVLISCTYASGGCAAAGTYAEIEELERGQKLICTIDGFGRGLYECGTSVRSR